MTNQIYNRDIPDGPNNPSQDQPKMKTNTNSIDNVLQIDHITFGDNQGGYHKTVHQPIVGTWTQAGRTAAPALSPLTTINQLIAMNVTPVSTVTATDTQLFSMTGNSNGTTNGVSQMTGSLVSGTDGYVWCAGILIQWGFFATSLNNTNGVIIFKDRVAGAIAFPNSCFLATAIPTYAGIPLPTGQATISIKHDTIAATGFRWNAVSNSSTYDGFYWIALGN